MSNPKDLIGGKKVSLTKIPTVALAWEALAMMDGAGKYGGSHNWRENHIQASIYVDAIKRHLDLWFEGQQLADDSGCHHLGHARAGLGILMDAEATGSLVDDRPKGFNLQPTYDLIAEKIVAMKERHKKFHEEQKSKSA